MLKNHNHHLPYSPSGQLGCMLSPSRLFCHLLLMLPPPTFLVLCPYAPFPFLSFPFHSLSPSLLWTVLFPLTFWYPGEGTVWCERWSVLRHDLTMFTFSWQVCHLLPPKHRKEDKYYCLTESCHQTNKTLNWHIGIFYKTLEDWKGFVYAICSCSLIPCITFAASIIPC